MTNGNGGMGPFGVVPALTQPGHWSMATTIATPAATNYVVSNSYG